MAPTGELDEAGSARTTTTQPRTGAPTVGTHVSLSALVATMFRSVRDIVVHTAEVAALESRAAGYALAAMAGIAVAILVLLLSTWGLLLAAGVRGLMELGMSVGGALLVAAAANLAVAVLLGLMIPRLARRLKFSATRRVLGKLGSET